MAKKKQLNSYEEAFAIHFVKTNNASAAYRAAYSTENMKPETVWRRGYEIKNRGHVKARIADLRLNIEESLGISKVSILNDLLEIRDRSMQRVPVMKYNPKTKEDEQVIDAETGEGVWAYDSSGANSAIDKVMKGMGYYEPEKKDITTNGDKITSVVVE